MMASATMPVNVRAAHTSIGNHLGANVEMEMAHGTVQFVNILSGNVGTLSIHIYSTKS